MEDTSSLPVILLAFANDRRAAGRYLRNLPEETRLVRQALRTAERRPLCTVDIHPNATLDEILDVLQDPAIRDRIEIVHFGGHAGSLELLFENAAGQPAAVHAASFAALLGKLRGLQLVFLNGCSTQPQVDALLQAGVPAVIATSEAIDDAAATELAGRFYGRLAAGDTLREAFEMAAESVKAARGGALRNVYAVEEAASAALDRWPWQYYSRPGAEQVDGWNLAAAADDPLFGLPDLPPLDLPDTPYRHLLWYRREDARIFFGREHSIRGLYDLVTAASSAPIVLLNGRSGVGKSSLLAAGLLPRLEGSHTLRYLRRDQGQGLLRGLLAALGAPGDAADLGAAWRQLEAQENRPLLVVLDQVEECFTRPNPAQPGDLAGLVAALCETFVGSGPRPRGKLVLGFRKEWLAEIDAQLAEAHLPRTRFLLGPLDRRGIVGAVLGPASGTLCDQYHLEVDPELPETLAADLLADAGSPVAPLLQIVLHRMWARATKQSPDRPCFDDALYRSVRAEGLGLFDFLDGQLRTLHAELPEAVDSGLALDLLAAHTTPLGTAEEQTGTLLGQAYRHQAGVWPPLVRQLQDLYVLVDVAEEKIDDPPHSRLAHDTLAPVVRARFDESTRPGQRARRILESRAVEWQNGTAGAPLDAQDLRTVEQGRPGMRAWKPDEERLVAASRAAVRAQRRRRWASPLLTVAAVAVLVLAGWAGYRAWLKAQVQAGSPQRTFGAARLTIGSDDPILAEFSHPQWQINYPAFDLDVYEVSNGQYCRCNRAGACLDHADGTLDVCDAAIADLPVRSIAQPDAETYCEWLGRRLPTEIEWEWAARGPANRLYPTGNERPVPGQVNLRTTAQEEGSPWPVQKVIGDVTPEKVVDLESNVAEWTISVTLPYADPGYQNWWSQMSARGPDRAAVRGGSFRDITPTRSSTRDSQPVADVFDYIGFRCVSGPRPEEIKKEVAKLNPGN